MPTRASSPSMRTHSWSLVYFNSDGYISEPPTALAMPRAARAPCSARPLVERHRHHLRPQTTAAHVYFERGAGARGRGRQVGHAERLLQEWGVCPAGDDTG